MLVKETNNEFKIILIFVFYCIFVIVTASILEVYIKSQNNVLKDLPPNTEIKLNNKSYIYTGKALLPLEDK